MSQVNERLFLCFVFIKKWHRKIQVGEADLVVDKDIRVFETYKIPVFAVELV